MKKTRIGFISLIAVLLMIAFTCMVNADSGVNATPEIQSITTGTSSSVQGTVTETDSGAWTLTYDPEGQGFTDFIANSGNGITEVGSPNQATVEQYLQTFLNEIHAQGGSAIYIGPYWDGTSNWKIILTQISIPTSNVDSFLNSIQYPGDPRTWQQIFNLYSYSTSLSPGSYGGIHNGALDPGQVQYTTGYNDQYSGISGQQTFAKSMAISTANKIADKSNIKANTNIQFVAIDTGRAMRSEDLLLDGAGNSTDTASSILCPFAQSVSAVIPPYCNIVQAGSAFDTTLTSTVTSADTRFVESDSTFPVVLNYNINAQGITLGNQTSPMIGSASAFLKVHVQEARNSTALKSEDLVYSETSSASGLISKFSKSMSYQSGFNLI